MIEIHNQFQSDNQEQIKQNLNEAIIQIIQQKTK